MPKTLIQHLIRWVISSGQFEPEVCEVLQSVLDTEITPELVPSGEEEELQSSEAKVGPFALQDFSLFHVLRYGFRPSKIAFLAWHAWRDPEAGKWPPGFPEDKRPSYSLKEIRHWMAVFVQRFYSFSQFKRSALPNGPKVSYGGSLSPRGIGARRRTCRRASGSTRSNGKCPTSDAGRAEHDGLGPCAAPALILQFGEHQGVHAGRQCAGHPKVVNGKTCSSTRTTAATVKSRLATTTPSPVLRTDGSAANPSTTVP